MKELLRTTNLAHAHALVAALDAAGIPAWLEGEHGGAMFGGISVLLMEDDDLGRAKALLADLERPSD